MNFRELTMNYPYNIFDNSWSFTGIRVGKKFIFLVIFVFQSTTMIFLFSEDKKGQLKTI